MKGILIVMVVMGHASAGMPYIDVYWFHMPLFFMITGLLTKKWLTFGDIFSIPKEGFTRKIIKSRLELISKLVLPYFCYCLLFYLIFHPEPLLKNIVRTLYAGANNVTIYSYPFWFVNALLIAKLIYGSIKNSKYVIIIILALWVVVHLNIFNNYITVPLPWSIDNALAALGYIYIGDKLKDYSFKLWHLSLLVLAPIFIYANNVYQWNYHLSMKSMTLDFPILDIIVPLFFAIWLYSISLFIKKFKVLTQILSYLSIASITIFFVHASIINITENHFSPWIRVICAVGASVLIHYTFSKFGLTRRLFLGKSQ